MKYASDSPSKSHKYPTTVRFDEDELPEVAKWKVGGKYKLTLEVEQISMSKGDEFEDEKKPIIRASFKVLSVTPEGRTKVLPKTQEVSEAIKKRV